MTRDEAEAGRRLLSWYSQAATSLCWVEYDSSCFNLQSGQQVTVEAYQVFMIKVLEPVIYLSNIVEIVEFIEERKRNPNL